MKKLFALLLVLTMLFAFASCKKEPDPGTTAEPVSGDVSGSDPSDASDTTAPSSEEETTLPVNIPIGPQTSMRETFNKVEYALYENIFYNKKGDDYLGEVEKEGVFSVIRDEYNERDRYYVWGYKDATRCCDYQWEIVPTDLSALPSPGSFIKVKGTFVYNKEEALDKYWIENAEVTLVEKYDGPDFDYDCMTMSPTLARVEIANIVRFPDRFAGKTVQIFGRTYNANCLQHPYYDNSWMLDFQADGLEVPTGTYLILSGVLTAEGEGCYLAVDQYKLAE